MDFLIIPSLLGFLIGLILGLLGGGGSILTVPALVYIVGQTPQVAVTASLLIVGSNSAMGALFHRSQGTLNWHVALLFGGTGMITAYFAAGIGSHLSHTLMLILFSLLMLLIAGIMLKRPMIAKREENEKPDWRKIVVAGAAVGALTGLLGVGGGFLIVPALVMLLGVPIQQAVGTSLIIIAMNSVAGLLGHIGQTGIDFQLILIFIVTGFVGSFTGVRLGKSIDNTILQRIFAFFIITVGLFVLMDNLQQLL